MISFDFDNEQYSKENSQDKKFKFFSFIRLTGALLIIIRIILWIDHPIQNDPKPPLGGTNTVKQNSSAKLACFCLSLGHLVAKL